MPTPKAVVATLVAVLTALGTALTDGGISPQEWVATILAGVVAYGAVYSTPYVTGGSSAPVE